MIDHPSADTRRQYLEGRLARQEFLDVDEHLAGCAACRDATSPAHAVVAESFREAIAGEHLTYEQMEAHIEGRGDASQHLDACSMCDAEVADLRRETAQEAQPRRWWVWAAAAAVAVAIFGGVLATRREPEPLQRLRIAAPRPVIVHPPVTVTKATPRPPALRPDLANVLRQLADGVLPSAALVEELNATTERTRGDTETVNAIAILAPLGVIEEARPRFRWTTRDEATYVVEVFDGSYRRVARSPALQAGTWRPDRPLARGMTYSWQVTEMHGDVETTVPAPPQPPAQFRIISTGASREIRGAGSRLEKALVYAREGMVDRALEEMENSPTSPDIRRAIETLRRYQPAPTTTKPPQ